jgi:glucosylceramidase
MALVLLCVFAVQFRSVSQTVNVWLTTDDQSVKLKPQVPATFVAGIGDDNPLIVDEHQTYQQIEGFGASFTDSAAYLLNRIATPAARTNAMNSLFTRHAGGIGVSFIRNPMGASDLARFVYSYDDLPPGVTDTNLDNFSIAHDLDDIVPLVRQARQLNPALKIMASPWSPPGWMKTSGSMITGSLLPQMAAPFAEYFVKYLQAFQAEGIPVDYLSLQNEPRYEPADYPGMLMDAATQTALLRDYILPALAAHNLDTRVLVYDHNWDGSDFPDTVLSDPTVLASARVAGTAWHGYGGTPGAMLTLANKYPTKGNYMTEHSGGDWAGDQVRADFEEITHVMRSGGRAYVKWSLALDQNHGPNTGGCNTCNPLVTINNTSGALSFNIDFYTLGHFSKFVLPDACRIYSANAVGVVSAAFLNPDGSKVLVAFNDTTVSRTFQVQWGNKFFTATLAGYSGATFTWTGAQSETMPVNPAHPIQASSFNSASGVQTEPTTDALGGYDVGYADQGDYAVYRNVDFAAGFTQVSAAVASAGSGGTLEFRLDAAAGPRIGTVPVPVTGGWQTWETVTGSVANASGVHDLYVVFQGGSSIGNLNWFQFGGAVPVTNHPPKLAVMPAQTILAGQILRLTNAATDADVPAQTLNYHLAAAPAGAALNPGTGIFSWRPPIASAPDTQAVAIVVSDSGTPVMSATQQFLVTVRKPAAPALKPFAGTNGNAAFWISGEAGPDYLLQTSTNLIFWNTISTSTPSVFPFYWADTNPVAAAARFYRAKLGP